MQELDEGQRAFSTFRVLNGDANVIERDQLFRNMAQLYLLRVGSVRRRTGRAVRRSALPAGGTGRGRGADARRQASRAARARARATSWSSSPTTTYRGRAAAARILQRAFATTTSSISSRNQSEAHRVAIAGRQACAERVGEAIVEHGEAASVIAARAQHQCRARQGRRSSGWSQRASEDADIAADLRGRADIDWKSLRGEIDSAGDKVLEQPRPGRTKRRSGHRRQGQRGGLQPHAQPRRLLRARSGRSPTTRSRRSPIASSSTTAR